MPKTMAKPPVRGRAATDTLRVLLIRHGKAQRHSESGRDEDRRLKPRGERQAKWLGRRLAQLKLVPEILLHSPAHRAVQTAARLAEQLACETKETDALSIGSPPRGVLDLIRRRRADSVVALVGHNPQLEELAQILVPQFRKNGVELRTGEALIVEVSLSSGLTDAKLVARERLDDDDED
ncbi:MAG: histidine phosphatase family protein [Phycisphaerales bacterium]